MFARSQSVPLLLTVLLLLGCGSGTKGPHGGISGKVTLDGNPVTAGQVSFFSSEMATGGMATIQADGTYQLETPLPTGEYAVTLAGPVEEPGGPAAPPFKVPPRYLQPASSGLTCTVSAGENTYDILLTTR